MTSRSDTQWPVWKLRLDLEPLEGRTPIDFKFCKVCEGSPESLQVSLPMLEQHGVGCCCKLFPEGLPPRLLAALIGLKLLYQFGTVERRMARGSRVVVRGSHFVTCKPGGR